MPDRGDKKTKKGQSKKGLLKIGLLESSEAIVSIIAGLIAVFLILYSSYVLYDTFYTQNKAFGSADAAQFKPVIIKDEETPLSNASLKTINEDYRSWLVVNNTSIDYPVMQGPNDLYYASHDIYKDISLTGAIYLAAANSPDLSDNYNIIYGHHMENGAMFGRLDDFLGREYFDEHRDGVIVTDGGQIYNIHTFAVMKTDAYERMVYTTGDRDLEEVMNYIRRNSSIYDLDTPDGVTPEKLVMFSTCMDTVTSGRLVIYAYAEPRETAEIIDGGDTPPAPPVEPHEEELTIWQKIMKALEPAGNAYGRRSWALLNLLAMLITIMVLIPLNNTSAKYKRGKLIKQFNEKLDKEGRSSEKIDEKRYNNRFWTGFALEIVLAAASLVLFLMTENMKLPMVLIDGWTPVMLLMLAATVAIDFVLAGYRQRVLERILEIKGNNE